MNKKGFTPILILFGILVLVVITGGYYLKTRNLIQNQTNNSSNSMTIDMDTSHWETYNNKDMGFSMKIPPLWFTHPVIKTEYGDSTFLSYPIDNPSTQNWNPKQGASMIISRSLSKGRNINQLAQERINMPYSYLENSPADINIDNHQGILLYAKDRNHHEEILVSSNDSTYLITLGTPVGSDTLPDYPSVPLEEIQPIFIKILSTFKFTN